MDQLLLLFLAFSLGSPNLVHQLDHPQLLPLLDLNHRLLEVLALLPILGCFFLGHLQLPGSRLEKIALFPEGFTLGFEDDESLFGAAEFLAQLVVLFFFGAVPVLDCDVLLQQFQILLGEEFYLFIEQFIDPLILC
jgi:hypothetical protein